MVSENFTQKLKPLDEVQYLITFRHDFKRIYLQNRLLFSEQLCNKIDSFILNVDRFIETYDSGLFPMSTEEEEEFNSEYNGGLFIAGVWSVNAFDGLKEIEQYLKA